MCFSTHIYKNVLIYLCIIHTEQTLKVCLKLNTMLLLGLQKEGGGLSFLRGYKILYFVWKWVKIFYLLLEEKSYQPTPWNK